MGWHNSVIYGHVFMRVQGNQTHYLINAFGEEDNVHCEALPLLSKSHGHHGCDVTLARCQKKIGVASLLQIIEHSAPYARCIIHAPPANPELQTDARN